MKNIDKTTYLNIDVVAQFVGYLAEIISGQRRLDFKYDYRNSQTPREFPFSKSGQADTLEDLFKRYWWRHQNYDANAVTLRSLQQTLRESLRKEVHHAPEVRMAFQSVLNWGLMSNAAGHNMQWADTSPLDLSELLGIGQQALEAERPDFDAFDTVRMNAGLTKVFSLLSEQLIIYDGRVGAALGWLVRAFLKSETELLQVPEALAFPWAPGVTRRHRNPSGDGFTFPRLKHVNGDKAWARANVFASWILNAARDKAGNDWCAGEEGLRRTEAALFMLGYELPDDTSTPQARVEAVACEEQESSRIRFIRSTGSFSVDELIDWIQRQGRDYIVIGGANIQFGNHTKPESLDFWLRGQSSHPDVRQSERALIEQLVATGRFTLEPRPCPHTSRICRSLVLRS